MSKSPFNPFKSRPVFTSEGYDDSSALLEKDDESPSVTPARAPAGAEAIPGKPAPAAEGPLPENLSVLPETEDLGPENRPPGRAGGWLRGRGRKKQQEDSSERAAGNIGREGEKDEDRGEGGDEGERGREGEASSDIGASSENGDSTGNGEIHAECDSTDRNRRGGGRLGIIFRRRDAAGGKEQKVDEGAGGEESGRKEPKRWKFGKDKSQKKETQWGSSFIKRLFGFFSEKMLDIASTDFSVADLSEPSPEGLIKHVDVTYLVAAPYQYVRVRYDPGHRELLYQVIEPQLSTDEQNVLSIIERAFEKMISTNIELILGGNRHEYLRERFDHIITVFGLKLTDEQRQRVFFHLEKDYLGYGKIDTLMKDKYIEDIGCNGADIDIYVQHRTYGSIRTNIRFAEVEVNNFVLKIAQVSGRHISLLQPIRDVTLPDGSRGNLTLGSEVTRKGSTFTIRKFRASPISGIELMEYGSIDAAQLAYLWLLMEYRRSILVSGGTASGKTTFLNVLCSFIPTEYKIVSIEDTAELNLMHPNWIQSVTRSGFGTGESSGSTSGVSGMSARGKAPGDISLYDLLVAALRQRPEFIIVGEVRGEEAFTLFQAIAVGHAAMGTIHAGSLDELLSRVESNPMNVPRSLLSNIDAVIFPMLLKKGERNIRRIVQVVEFIELDREKGDLITNTVFKWNAEDDEFRFTGKSYLFDRIRDIYGVKTEVLKQEYADRTRFLNWLKDHNIRDFDEVVDYIRIYYRDKDVVMNLVDSDASPPAGGLKAAAGALPDDD